MYTKLNIDVDRDDLASGKLMCLNDTVHVPIGLF